ncbi:MAG TPA: galactose-1-phosphate uridylyltransferase, partial [Actinomycetota bacterium]|nr:galactose-1-phosphate uridylyltransferase [Actinomycetota bacterium]
MSTLRQDPTTRQWAILATRREERPHEPVVIPRPELPERDPGCPFCPGNEDQTPPEILREPPGPNWQVRVVPNMYAALSGDGSAGRSGEPMFREMPGIGSHEVVIETPRHDGRMEEMQQEEVASVVRMWRERYRTLISRPDVRAVVVFKNFGALAGTSL